MEELNKDNMFDLGLIQSKIILAQHNQTGLSTTDEKINEARKLGYIGDIIYEYLTLVSMYEENKHEGMTKEMKELKQRFMTITTLAEDPNIQLILNKFLEDILDEQLNQTQQHLSLIEDEQRKVI